VALYQIDWRDMQYSAQTQNRAFSFLTNIGASAHPWAGVRGRRARVLGWDLAASA
jgi:iron complex outermembrane receptor protein